MAARRLRRAAPRRRHPVHRAHLGLGLPLGQRPRLGRGALRHPLEPLDLPRRPADPGRSLSASRALSRPYGDESRRGRARAAWARRLDSRREGAHAGGRVHVFVLLLPGAAHRRGNRPAERTRGRRRALRGGRGEDGRGPSREVCEGERRLRQRRPDGAGVRARLRDRAGGGGPRRRGATRGRRRAGGRTRGHGASRDEARLPRPEPRRPHRSRLEDADEPVFAFADGLDPQGRHDALGGLGRGLLAQPRHVRRLRRLGVPVPRRHPSRGGAALDERGDDPDGAGVPGTGDRARVPEGAGLALGLDGDAVRSGLGLVAAHGRNRRGGNRASAGRARRGPPAGPPRPDRRAGRP